MCASPRLFADQTSTGGQSSSADTEQGKNARADGAERTRGKKDVTTIDYINAGLLVAAVVGIALSYWQFRYGTQMQRAMFLKDLYSTLTSDADIADAWYCVEYRKFKYDPKDFHGSVFERKLDRLLAFADLTCELKKQGFITPREMAFFEYPFSRIATNDDVAEYLKTLALASDADKLKHGHFHSFRGFMETIQARGSPLQHTRRPSGAGSGSA